MHQRRRDIRKTVGYGVLGIIALVIPVATVAVFVLWNPFTDDPASWDRGHGRILGSDSQTSCDRGGGNCQSSSYITVALTHPVLGVSRTVVDYPDLPTAGNGEAIRVLLDPGRPRTAEVPGHPNMTTSVMLACAGLTVLDLAVCGAGLFRWRQTRRRRAAHTGAKPPGDPPQRTADF